MQTGEMVECAEESVRGGWGGVGGEGMLPLMILL